MLGADVLIESEVAHVAHVAQAIADLDGVQVAEDSLALRRHRQSQASGLDELGRLIVVRIQVVDGVTRTLTCMVLHREPHATTARAGPVGAGVTMYAARFGADTHPWRGLLRVEPATCAGLAGRASRAGRAIGSGQLRVVS